MTWLRRFRPVLFVAGGLLVVGSLLGARLFAHGTGDSPGAAPAPQTKGSGPVVIGYVDSDPRPIEYRLPPAIPSGEVVKVAVTAGQDVEAGGELYVFDNGVAAAQVATAERAVETARVKVREARTLARQHMDKVRLQAVKVKAAETKVYLTQKNYHVYESNLRAELAGKFAQDVIEKKVKDDAKLFELETAYRVALNELDAERANLQTLEGAAGDTQGVMDEAEAEVRRYEALLNQAKVVLDQHVVRTKVAGTIERVSVTPGDVLSPMTRTPAIVLIPRGPRIVRAEVEAEFAHRVSNDLIGKTVTVEDYTNQNLTYKGTVKLIGTAFLPKRSSGDALVASDTRVLEAVVEVLDPAPPRMPPLRVGQKVRVNFGQ